MKNGHQVFAWMLSWPYKEVNSILFSFLFSFRIAFIVWRLPILSRLVIPVSFNCVSWHGFECNPHHLWHKTSGFIFSLSKCLTKWNGWQCPRCGLISAESFSMLHLNNPFVLAHIKRLGVITCCYFLLHILLLNPVPSNGFLVQLCFLVPSTTVNIYLIKFIFLHFTYNHSFLPF